MATFGLVHGAWHGAWCWERLVPELIARGHHALTVDLPIDDPTAATERYAQVALDAFATAPDDLILVGHSMGGIVIPIVAARRRVRRLVYVCPVVRLPGRSLEETLGPDDGDASAPGWGSDRIIHEDPSTSWPPEAAIRAFYADCDPATAAWAAARLRRQYWHYWQERNPIEATPPTEVHAIVGAEDDVITLAWARRRLPVLLGVDPEVLPGGHSPFLARPAELAETLTRDL